MFEHEMLEEFSLKQVTLPAGRYYEDEKGNKYISVTTLLGQTSDKSGLEKWQKRVGKKEAAKVLKQAGKRGSNVHDVFENYLLNEEIKYPNPFIQESFNVIKPYLDLNITKIFGLEHRLYSPKLKVAGTADVICLWKNKLTVLDFKTSRKPKKEEYIQNYFLQATFYAVMIYELYGIKIEDIVIIIYVDHERQPMIFEKRVKSFLNNVKEKARYVKPLLNKVTK